jgi:hypothetical protein
MYNEVNKFFALHHHLVLPGIGNFKVETSDSQIDFANRTIVSAQNKITFGNDRLQPEKNFYNFLADELNINEEQATISFAIFTSEIRNDLDADKPVYFKGIGTLTREKSRTIAFQSETLPSFYPVVTAEKIIRKNVGHTILVGEKEKTSDEMQTVLQQTQPIKKERWWIAAAVLAIIGVATIAFYYLTHK